MPVCKFVSVVSCNSEDADFPAKNLLSEQTIRKWKCLAQEKQAVAVLQLAESARIVRVDVGNEHSAFVELLVGRSTGSTGDDDYQVLLPASSFMNPNESRNGRNVNRVRSFKECDLTPSVAKQNWDRVKVICTQPFVKNVQYGLSFLRMTMEGDEAENTPPMSSLLAVDEDTAVDDFAPGSLFQKRTSAAADARQQRPDAAPKPPVPQPASHNNVPVKPATAPARPPQTAKPPSVARERSPSVKRRKVDDSPSPASASSSNKAASSVPEKKSRKSAPFNKLLDGVVVVLSGFQNPYRGELRQHALDMGARYRADWDRQGTHLVCAFANTPKYNQVKGRGKIVSRDWLVDCHRQKKKLPWRRYAMDPSDKKQMESDEEIWAEELGTSSAQNGDSKESKGDDPDFVPSPKGSNEAEDDSGEATDVDTDEEVDRIKAGKKKPQTKRKPPTHTNTPSKQEDQGPGQHSSPAATASSAIQVDADGLPVLPDFFTGMHFLLFGEFTATERRQVVRFVKAFGGVVENYMGSPVTHVLSRSSDWQEDFDEAAQANGELKFVNSDWILECGRRNVEVDVNDYLVVRNK